MMTEFILDRISEYIIILIFDYSLDPPLREPNVKRIVGVWGLWRPKR